MLQKVLLIYGGKAVGPASESATGCLFWVRTDTAPTVKGGPRNLGSQSIEVRRKPVPS